jgi:hypothetical protein
VDQVSRPLILTLLATVVLAAGWMAFLRPGAVQSTTEQVTAPAKVATQAAEAAAATDKASAATEAATKALESATTQTSPAQGESQKAAKPKAAAKAEPQEAAKPKTVDGQAAVLRDMDAGKVVVLLFWDKAGADDRAARDAAKDVNLRDGKVAVHLVAVENVGDYGSVTQGVSVTQTPTTMVITPGGKARTVAGLTERTEVDQLVRDALASK